MFFALCMSIWYLFFFYKSTQNQGFKYVFLAALMLMFATLAKLPFIVLGAATFIYMLRQWYKKGNGELPLLLKEVGIYASLMVFPLLWYYKVIPTWEGNGIVHGLLDNKIDWEKAIVLLKYHRDTMFPLILMNKGCWFFFVFAIFSFFKNQLFKRKEAIYLMFALVFVLFYFIFELNMIGIAHDYYMMPFLPFLFIAIVYGVKESWKGNNYIKGFVLFSLILMCRECLKQNKNNWSVERSVDSGFSADLYTHQEALKNIVPKGEKCIILRDISTYVFSYLIDKQGFVFGNDHVPAGWIVDMVQNSDVKYMYSDSRAFEENPNVKLPVLRMAGRGVKALISRCLDFYL